MDDPSNDAQSSDGQSNDGQSDLWQSADSAADPIDEATTRGTLDMGAAPDELRRDRRAAHRLHVRLEKRLETVDLVLTDNRRRMVSSRTRRGRQQIRLHHMFVGCSEAIVDALAELAAGRKQARDPIRAYVQDNRDAIDFEPTDDELQAAGEHFNLDAILCEVRRAVDIDRLAAIDELHITWGRRGRGAKSIRFGSYDFDRKLIRIHPGLDASWVPRYFVAFIVYHELLHVIFPPRQGQTRRQVHTPEFRAMERRFPDYDKAIEWEEANLEKFLDDP